MDRQSSNNQHYWATLVELLRSRSVQEPEGRIYSFLDDTDETESTLTYGELDRRAQSIAAVLQKDVSAGERALLLYPPGLEFISAFFGCLYAGIIAVPAYPPRLNRSLERIQAIVADAQASVVLTTTTLSSKLEI